MFRTSIVALMLTVAAPAFAGEYDDLNREIERMDRQRDAAHDRRSRELAADSAAVEARWNAERQAEAIDRLTDAVDHQNVILCCPRY